MSAKRMQPETRRSIYYVIVLSLFLLLVSCSTLLWSGNNYNPFAVNPTPITQFHVHPRFNHERDVRASDERKLITGVCDPNNASIKVYMYDLPPEYHFGLLGWKEEGDQIWPDIGDISSIPRYPGGLNLQHSVEYWLTLDLLATNLSGVVRSCAAVRVMNQGDADVIFVPFFSSLSYNQHSKLCKNEKVSEDILLQRELVNFLKK